MNELPFFMFLWTILIAYWTHISDQVPTNQSITHFYERLWTKGSQPGMF